MAPIKDLCMNRSVYDINSLFLTIVTEDDDSDGKSKLNGSQSDSDIERMVAQVSEHLLEMAKARVNYSV